MTRQMTRAVVLAPRSQGTMRKVSISGCRYMSDSAMRAKPSMDEPSNQVPCSIESRNWWVGMVTLFTIPTMSVNWRLMKRTCSCSICSKTLRDSVIYLLHEIGFAGGCRSRHTLLHGTGMDGISPVSNVPKQRVIGPAGLLRQGAPSGQRVDRLCRRRIGDAHIRAFLSDIVPKSGSLS